MKINKLGLLSSLLGIINNEADEESTSVILAKYFLANIYRLPELNIYDVADECFVTRASIRRFCQALGYDNYKDLKEQFDDMQKSYRFYIDGYNSPFNPQNYAAQLYEMACECNRSIIEHVDEIAELIKNSNQIVFLVSDIYSRNCVEFQKIMIMHGKMTRIVSQKYDDNKLISSLTDKDLLFTVSVGGYFAEAVKEIIEDSYCKKILLTSRRIDEFQTIYDQVLYLCENDLGAERTVYHSYAVSYCLDLIAHAYTEKL